MLRRAAARKLENLQFLITRYYLAFFNGSQNGMEREIALSRGMPGAEDLCLHQQAVVLAHSGQMRQARMMWEGAIALAQQNGQSRKSRIYQTAAAFCEAHAGECGSRETARSGSTRGRKRPGCGVWGGVCAGAAGRGAEAAAEFQKVLDNRGIVFADPIGALAHCKSGKALPLSGDTARAKAAYQDFLNLWSHADEDLTGPQASQRPNTPCCVEHGGGGGAEVRSYHRATPS